MDYLLFCLRCMTGLFQVNFSTFSFQFCFEFFSLSFCCSFFDTFGLRQQALWLLSDQVL